MSASLVRKYPATAKVRSPIVMRSPTGSKPSPNSSRAAARPITAASARVAERAAEPFPAVNVGQRRFGAAHLREELAVRRLHEGAIAHAAGDVLHAGDAADRLGVLDRRAWSRRRGRWRCSCSRRRA